VSDRDGFLAAIHDAPDDAAPRLIFADWLEENGEAEHAEFIRVQVEMRRERERSEQISPKLDELFLRQRELFKRPWAKVASTIGAKALANFTRGFPNSLNLSAKEFVAQGPTLAAWIGPQTQVEISGCGGQLAAVGQQSALRFVSVLHITRQNDKDNYKVEDAVAFFASPYLSGLCELWLKNPPKRLSANVGRAIASATSMTRLLRLTLNGVKLESDGVIAIANAPHLASLTHLYIFATGMDDLAVAAVVTSPYLANLKALNVHDNPISDDGFRRLYERYGRGVVIPDIGEER